MLARIALFELRFQLRRPITWISFVILALLAFGITTIMGLEASAVPVNSPARTAFIVSLFGVFAMFLSVATIADVALRDGNSRMDAILRVMPLRTSAHYGPRFAGAYVVAALCFLGVVLGYMAGAAMPWVTDAAAGPFRLDGHAMAFVVMALPTLFATGALFFTIATLTRRLMATYLAAIALLILLIAAGFLTSHPDYRTMAALLDPFGIYAFLLDTKLWTLAERATRPLPLDALIMWNRLLWLGISGLLLVLSFTLFSARERRPRAPRVDFPVTSTARLMIDRPVIAAGSVGVWDQLMLRTRHETRSILRSWTFIVLLILGLIVAAGVLSILSLVDTANVSTTPVVAHALAMIFALITVLVPIAYGGELIWRDRSAKIAQIVDATPAPNVVFLASKVIAVALVIAALLAVAITSGIVFQLIKGAETIDVGYYLIKLTMFVGLPALMYGVLAILIQTIVNRKFVGLLIMLALLGVVAFAPELGITHKLLVPFDIPDPGMVDNYAAFLPALWYAGYWTGIAVLFAMVSHLLWVRGSASLWTRLKRVHQPVTPAAALVAVLAISGSVATGGYIYWWPYRIGSGFAAATQQSVTPQSATQHGWGADKLIAR